MAPYLEAHRWDDRELCEGHLVSALRSLFARFHRLCPQPFALEPEGPIPLRRARALEEQALREALLNLVAHQDYADVSRTATVLWWSDRVVFYNPGDSFVATEDLWTGGFSETRNPLIARVLRQAGLAEQAGSGLPLIRRTWDETGRPAPELRNDSGRKRFEVTFLWGEEGGDGVNEPVLKHSGTVNGPAEGVNQATDGVNRATDGVNRATDGVNRATDGVNRATDGVNDGTNDGVNGGVRAETLHERLVALITSEPGLRVPALHSRLGVSKATVERALRKLKADRLVDFRGATKTGGYYAISSNKDADS